MEDLINWSAAPGSVDTITTELIIPKVMWEGKYFIAYNYNNEIMTSADGLKWNKLCKGSSKTIYSESYPSGHIRSIVKVPENKLYIFGPDGDIYVLSEEDLGA